MATMEPQWADDQTIRKWDQVLTVMAEQHGLRNLALGELRGELIAEIDSARTYFDVARFELAVEPILGAPVRITLSGAPSAHVRAPLNDTAAA